jgi:hypothetical protein
MMNAMDKLTQSESRISDKSGFATTRSIQNVKVYRMHLEIVYTLV